MKKIIALYFMLVILLNCYPQENEWDTHNLQGFGETAKHGLIASGETILSNLIVIGFNGFISKELWAFPTGDSIKNNLRWRWEWEPVDGHIVNQLGHPYQGSVYFSAGRANNFGFYESIFFSAFGSYTWEALCESVPASINDLITTTVGSIAVGEVLYRLYAEALAAGIPAPLAFLINPAAGFHSLVTGWKPAKTQRNLYQFTAYTGASYSNISHTQTDYSDPIYSFNGFAGDFGVNIIYGDPFDQETYVPYRHFEVDASIGFDLGEYKNIRIISDGYLFSYLPVYTDKDKLTTGLSLHFDFICLGKYGQHDGTIDLYSNALDWTLKYRHLFSDNTNFQIKSHTGFTFFGTSGYYTPITMHVVYKNYGYGINSKLYLILENTILGKLEASALYYILWPYYDSSPVSSGQTYWIIADIKYSYFFTKHISLGISNSYSVERGKFKDFPNTDKWNNTFKLFIAWNM